MQNENTHELDGLDYELEQIELALYLAGQVSEDDITNYYMEE
jgi:hypothetical protein